MLKCATPSKNETGQVNECVRRILDEEAKVGTKRSVTRDTYTPEDRVKIGRYAAENGPTRATRATRHFTVPKTTGRRLKAE